jgi:hypothetical protein
MDTLMRYRDIVRKLICAYASYKPSHGCIKTEAIIDPETDHYEVMHVGWDGVRRVHGCVVHIDILERRLGNGPLEVDQTTFRSQRHRDNNYLLDRQAQKTRSFTGIEGINTQDRAV